MILLFYYFYLKSDFCIYCRVSVRLVCQSVCAETVETGMKEKQKKKKIAECYFIPTTLAQVRTRLKGSLEYNFLSVRSVNTYLMIGIIVRKYIFFIFSENDSARRPRFA